MARVYHYDLFGMRVASAVELPELVPAADQRPVDLIVKNGMVPQAGEHDGVTRSGADQLLTVVGVARFLVSDADVITVDADEKATARNVRVFLLGSAMSLVLHRRGILPLHANAILVDGRAVCFAGQSGAGKSTLAAWFHDRGYRLLTDDVCALRLDGEAGVVAAPGVPRLRLWRSALEQSGRDAALYEPSFNASQGYDKFDVPLARGAIAAGMVPLAAIYVLDRNEEGAMSIDRVENVAALVAIVSNTYRGSYLADQEARRQHLAMATAIVTKTPIFLVKLPWGYERLDADARRLEEHARGACGRDFTASHSL